MANIVPTTSPKRGLLHLWDNLSVRLKISVTILTVVLISVTAITLLSLFLTSSAITINASKSLNTLAKTAANDVAALLERSVENLRSYALDPELVNEIEKQNTAYSGTSADILAELTALDQQWTTASDADPIIQKWLTNPSAVKLDTITFALPEYAEIFVTDRYGGLAGTSNRTSDY